MRARANAAPCVEKDPVCVSLEPLVLRSRRQGQRFDRGVIRSPVRRDALAMLAQRRHIHAGVNIAFAPGGSSGIGPAC